MAPTTVEVHPMALPRRRADGRGRRAALLTLAAMAACGGATGDATPRAASAASAAPPAAASSTGQPVAPTSLNPGASLRRDTTGAPYDASAADSVQRRAAALATGETDPALIGGDTGMELPGTVPVSQVGAGPTVTQRDGGGDRYDGGRYAAASAFIDRQGRVYYTDAGGRVMSEAEVYGSLRFSTVAPGEPALINSIATGSVAAYQPNAPDAPGAVDRNAAWGGASPEVAAKLARGTAVAPVAPAVGDSARPASPGGPLNPAVPNAVLAPTAANARAVLTFINSAQIRAAQLGEERLSTPALEAFAGRIRADHEAQLDRLERIPGQLALTPAQRQAIGQAIGEQVNTFANLQSGAPNFDTQWISAQVATYRKALNDLRALGPAVQGGPLGGYVAQLTAGVAAHLQEAQRLQTRPGSMGPAPR